MRTGPGLALAGAGLFLALTYLFTRGGAPDAALHQRALGALHAVLLHDAALQRDALRARAGLLGSYDPLVEAVGGLRRAMTELLAAAAGVRGGSAAAVLVERHARLGAAVDAREELVEALKSENALLQNSTRYFTHAVDRLTGLLAEAPHPVAIGVAALGSAMQRFVADPGASGADRLEASLDQVAGLPAPPPLRVELQALVPHGRLIASTLPAVDDLLARLLATPVAEQAGAFREAYLEHHGRAEARAELSRLLLYPASVLLLAYLGHLFLRLQARLRFERLIATLAAEFVGLPREATMDGIRRGLARLAGQLGADRAYVLLPGAEGDARRRAFHWVREGGGAAPPGGWPETALGVCERRAGADGGRQGSVLVPRVAALPAGRDRAALEASGAHAWLCVPMRRPSGERIGFLGFERARFGGRRWRDEDAALLSTAGEIFASALERERVAAEQEALEAELRQAQRMEAVGTLAGGIAHDFNNILGAIMGYAEMALEALPRGGRTWEHVRQVWKSGERARGVIDQILAFSRRGEPERRPVRLRTVCEEAIDLLRASLPATVVIRLRVEAAADEAMVLGDPGRLQLVVLNLCTNAAQAMDERGNLDIALDAVEAEHETRLSHGPPLPPGKYLRLRHRHGAGHRCRHGRAHIRALLHHQGARLRHRPRPRHGPRRGGRPWRAPRLAQPPRRRQHLRGLPAADRGAAGRGRRAGRGRTRAPRSRRDRVARGRRTAAGAARRGDARRARLRADRVRQRPPGSGGLPRRSHALRPRAHRRGDARHDRHGAGGGTAPTPPRAAGGADDRPWRAGAWGSPARVRHPRGAAQAARVAHHRREPRAAPAAGNAARRNGRRRRHPIGGVKARGRASLGAATASRRRATSRTENDRRAHVRFRM
jgi:signal transduction histidine kinase